MGEREENPKERDSGHKRTDSGTEIQEESGRVYESREPREISDTTERRRTSEAPLYVAERTYKGHAARQAGRPAVHITRTSM